MNKILICGDIHTKLHIIQAVEKIANNYQKIIFMGDYVDDWDKAPGASYNTLYALIELKEKHPNKIILLYGNHDLSEWYGGKFACSGFNPATSTLVRSFFQKEAKNFQLAWSVDNYLFTHAGVTEGWWKNNFNEPLPLAQDYENQLNTIIDYNPEILTQVGYLRGGHQHPSPVWADNLELIRDPLPKINQIIGHTPVETCTEWEFKKEESTCSIWMTDTHSTTPLGINIGDNSLLELDLDTDTFTIRELPC